MLAGQEKLSSSFRFDWVRIFGRQGVEVVGMGVECESEGCMSGGDECREIEP